jgi:hypothetical protein
MIPDNTESLLERGINLISRNRNRYLFHIHIDWKLGSHENYNYEAIYFDGDNEPVWKFIE